MSAASAEPLSTSAAPPNKQAQRLANGAVSHLLLAGIAVFFALPFVWLLVTSLKLPQQIFTNPPIWIPDPVQWSNYTQALNSPAFPYLRLFANTVLYVGVSTVGLALTSAFVAYAFARLRFYGRDLLFSITLATMMVPGVVTLIPTYVLFRNLGWVGTYAPLIVPHLLGNAFSIFLIRQFMLTIPWELSDSARVDGANEFAIFFRIILPLIKPALLVVGLFHFTYTWNDFLGPLIYLDDPAEYPLVLGLYSFQTRFAIEWHLTMAASMAVVLPLIVLFFFAQRYFIEGITLTGLKG
jgi:multiple sugar transport system permease protein